MDTNRPRLLPLLALLAALGLAGAACGSADDSVASVGQVTSFVLVGHEAEFQGLRAGLFDREISVDPRFGVFDRTLGEVANAIAVTESGSSDAAGVDSAQVDGSQS